MLSLTIFPHSNTGGNLITETTLDFWNAGQKREEIEYKDLEPYLSQSLFNEQNSEDETHVSSSEREKHSLQI